jgi:D-glycero-beta-D-manno-heptose-7-phosphate kinase
MYKNPRSILQKLQHRKVLILGDVMLDRYLTGSVSRISPEAPVPIVLHGETEDRLGGAANVALNIRALGSAPVLCSVVGRDADGDVFSNILRDLEIAPEGIVSSDARCTTVKTRILGNNQQMLRIDREQSFDLTDTETAGLLARVEHLLAGGNVEALIFQDYNKGVLTPTVIEKTIALAQKHGIPTAVDPKKHNFFAYRGVDLFKPNLKEIRDSAPFAVQPDTHSLQQASDFLRAQLQHRRTMITLSEKGLFYDADTSGPGRIYPTIPRNVADVSGAGDTVISVAALGLAAGFSNDLIAVLSNLAGGQVCEFPGVVPVDRSILATELAEHLSAAKNSAG